MYIESLAISNYKSFLERQVFNFEPGFNLLLGGNNAGKTSALEVLDLNIGLNEPHRSNRTIPEFGGQSILPSDFDIQLISSYVELKKILASHEIYLPVNIPNSGVQTNDDLRMLVKDFICSAQKISINSNFGNGKEILNFKGNTLIQGTIIRNSNDNSKPSAQIKYLSNNDPVIEIANFSGGSNITINYFQAFKTRIYRFSAQRKPGFTNNSSQGTHILDREATNLPYCINYLQTNDSFGHEILCNWINRIFPSVKWVQAPPNGGNFEIKCLPLLPEDRRDDLATPLSRMGAGIGNVIAILYVVLTSREPQVIVIDEPNAFLHPRALRELLAILESEGKQHQFILTAHSADVLTAVNTRSISLLNFDGVATTVERIGSKDLHSLRGGLAELGIRMTDLHAKDRVFWVEGQTEELVMPEILRWACPEVAAGTSVLRVERTGTFSKKGIEPKEIVDIYERLSSSSAMVPPMVCILLDGEKLTVKNRNEVTESSKGKLRYLDRSMLENYLFHPAAIVSTFAELGEDFEAVVVHDALCKALGREDLNNDFAEVDGAKILKTIFSELSGAKQEFRKTRDVPTLVSWLLENDPQHLEPLRLCIRKSFDLG
jgi:predicted ATPase